MSGAAPAEEVRAGGVPAAEGEGACPNCGAGLHGPFCHACGQRAEPPPATFRGFVAHAAADLSSIDSRALRSLGLLLGRPGVLTREYLAGRRIRYTGPLQLYLAAAAAFFFVNAYRPFLRFDPRTLGIESTLNSVGVSGRFSSANTATLAAKGISMEVFGERFEAAVTGYLPTFLVGSVLLFALVLALVYRRRGYLTHAVFALHWTAFYLLLMIADRLLPEQTTGRGPMGAALAALAFTYLGLAIRRVYAPSWLGTAAGAAGLFLAYQLLLSVWMLSAVAVAFAILL